MRPSIAGLACSLFLCLTQVSAHGQEVAQLPVDQSQGPVASEQADATRQRLDREREALKSTLSKEQQACRQGFWVNACLSEAQARYRQALKPLQQQQQAMEQNRRRQIGAQARQRVQDKLAAQDARSLRADRSLSLPAESSEAQPAQAGRQAQARERVSDPQREAAVDQHQPDREGAGPPRSGEAQAEKPVR